MLGKGLIKGLRETAKNFVGSYHDPTRLVTIEYPEEKLELKENTRNFPFLVYEGNDSERGLRCVACKICEKECPPQCIYIVLERDEKGKPQKHPRVFDIDISVCMSCQICVEVCPFDAIKMDQVYELSRFDRFEGLLLHKKDLAKSNGYYHSIHPTEAREVDERLSAEKAKAEAAKAAKVASPSGVGPGPKSAESGSAVKAAASPPPALSNSAPPQSVPAKSAAIVPPPAPKLDEPKPERKAED
jgi:NADH-quinone oxidoreductase subunit I